MTSRKGITIHVEPDAPDGAPALAPPAADSPGRVTAFDFLTRQPWAIEPAMLETLRAIAQREHEPLDAVEARLGRKLQNARTVTVRDGVAIVPVTGPVFRYANLFTDVSGATSLDVLARDFTAALDDPQVASIVLAIDSPGGQAAGIAEFAQMVRAAKKPVTAYVDDRAASAAYWIAAAAPDLVIARTAEVGSIGVVAAFDVSRDDSRVEIVSSQSPHKRPDVTTDEGRALVQARVDALAEVFIADVAAYRGVDADTVRARFGQGGLRMGADAVAAGMADRLGSLEDTIAGLAGTAKGAPRMAATDPTPTLTLEHLAEHHPALLESIRTAARAEGAQDERARMLAVEAQALPGHEALIATLKADGKTTGPEAAVAVLQAERTRTAAMRVNLAADAPKPLPNAPAPDDDAAAIAALPLEERCKAQWEKNSALRDEFTSLATYTAYVRSIESGRARVVAKK